MNDTVAAPALSRQDRVFNFVACLIDSVGWPVGMAFFSTMTVIPLLFHRLGGSSLLLGLLVAVMNLLILLPGMFVAPWIARLPRARGFLLLVAVLERLALLPLAPLTALWGLAHPAWLLNALCVCLILNSAIMGFNQPAYWVVIGKSIPATWRGRLFGYAAGISGILGIEVERLIRAGLAGPGDGFPHGYSAFFLVGFVVMTATCLALGLVREPSETFAAPAASLSQSVGAVAALWRSEPPLRRFLHGQCAYYLMTLAGPFYVLYAQRRLGAGPADIGGYAGAVVFATAFGGLGWGAWSDKQGNRVVLLWAMACGAASGLLACVASSSTQFYAVFAGSALSSAGVGLAGYNLVMEYAPKSRDIPLYTSLYNAVTAAPRAIAPIVGGLIAMRAGGFQTMFLLSATLAAVSLVLTWNIHEPRGAAVRGEGRSLQ